MLKLLLNGRRRRRPDHKVHHNPLVLLEEVSYRRFTELEADNYFLDTLNSVYDQFKEYMAKATDEVPKLAYFSMEYGLTDNLKIYSGGFNEIGYFKKDNIASNKFYSLTHLLSDEAKNFDEVWKIVIHPDGIIFQSFNQLMIYKDSAITVIPAPSKFHFSFLLMHLYFYYFL